VRTVFVEDLLEVYYPLRELVRSYSCPPMDGVGTISPKSGAVGPSVDLTFVIDMGLALQELSTAAQNVLTCVYGGEMTHRGAARALRIDHKTVKSRQEAGLRALGKEVSRRRIRLTLHQTIKYG
jgi:hypothetical protein